MSDARSRAQSLRNRSEKAAAAETAAAEKVRTRPAADSDRKVRQTVDLTQDNHKALATWRLDTAVTLGRTRLTTQDVLRAAIDVLLADEATARRVRIRLEEIQEAEER